MLFYPLVLVDIDSPDALWGSLLIIRLPTTDIASELQIHAISALNCEFPYPQVCGDWYALGLTKSDSDNGRSFHQGGFANCLHASSQDLWRQFCENQIQQSHNPATTQYGEDHFQRQKVKRIKWKTIRKKDTDQKKNKRQKCNWNRIIQPAPNMGRITSLLSLKAFASSDGKTENPRSFSRRAPHRLFFRPDFRQISCNELIVSQTSSPLSLWIFKTQIAKANIQYLLLRSNFDFS